MLKFPAKAKTSFYLITATTGFAAAFNFHSLNPNFPAFSDDSLLLSSTFPEKIRTGINAVFRSSRAVTTIALNVVDYKYSLHGLPLKSEEYRHTLSEVHVRSAKRILKLCEANKGFYVKAGQFVAALRQVPNEYISILSSLQDQAVPCNFKDIKEVLIGNLGRDLSEIFENMLLEEEGFKEMLKNWWVGLNFNGSHGFVLVAKLRALRVVLKSWNKDVFNFIEARKRVALSQVVFWDEKEKKPYLVRWKTVCSKRKKGELGVRCISTMNKALLCKWSWLFANERGAFWIFLSFDEEPIAAASIAQVHRALLKDGREVAIKEMKNDY
uniref:ABC1 atypical kinase-like domain-containing protein n=1 Tax=Vitis vinifera TaxID=29760 RepID=A5C6Q7_VITVI|nr:hypothetical protein VITISV_013210 [Vitis vinifera]